MSRLKDIRLTGWAAIAGILGSIATVLALFVGGGDSQPASDPAAEETETVETFGTRLGELFHAGDYAAMWEEFHPAIKEVIPLETYVQCEEELGLPFPVKSVKAAGVGATVVDMEGLPATVSIVGINSTTLKGEKPIRESVNIVRDDGELYFVPQQYEYDAYLRDECPPPVDPALEQTLPGDDVIRG